MTLATSTAIAGIRHLDGSVAAILGFRLEHSLLFPPSVCGVCVCVCVCVCMCVTPKHSNHCSNCEVQHSYILHPCVCV